jgi:hypothetical protein
MEMNNKVARGATHRIKNDLWERADSGTKKAYLQETKI